jgi:hypothetical protein
MGSRQNQSMKRRSEKKSKRPSFSSSPDSLFAHLHLIILLCISLALSLRGESHHRRAVLTYNHNLSPFSHQATQTGREESKVDVILRDIKRVGRLLLSNITQKYT